MSAEVTIGEGGGARLEPHPLRAAVLGEVHARPFTPIETPRRVLHFAFDTTGERGDADRAALVDFCTRRGLLAPKPGDKHHLVAFGGTALRWEQHSEFTTYTWELPAEGTARFQAEWGPVSRPESALTSYESGARSDAKPVPTFAERAPPPGATPFHPPAATLAAPMALLPQPGPALVALDLHLLADGVEALAPERLFDRASLAAFETGDGAALVATDFKSDPAGFVRILTVDRGLGPERAGALVQRVIEAETYRTLALLGLPQAQRLAPSVGRIEQRLAELTEEMRRAEGLTANRRLLDELTALAAELEAGGAASLFRFGASRAYNEIVQLRLHTIGERPLGGYPTWSAFLARRMAPAMRTCATVEERQANLSTKLARAANLLRTRVDVELEQQNRNLLQSMNERTRLQLRLQATVEGLSVAAISYYVIGLLGYVVKASHDAGAPVEPSYATAALVPLTVLVIWWVVRRIRRRHIGRGR